MVKGYGLIERYKKPLQFLGVVILAAAVVLLLVAVAWFCLFVYTMSSMDDPYRPQAPYYQYTAYVTGLDGFATDNGSAVIMLPLPVVNGTPVLSRGWAVNYPAEPAYRYHGMLTLEPVDTSMGPMLEARINMTDYYVSYARVTPIAISPGRNASELPAAVPDVINKSWSFDDVAVTASGGAGALDYPTSAQGRAEIVKFLEAPLAPAVNDTGPGDFTTYVYIDPALKPLRNDRAIRISGALEIKLNHNKVNVSEEGQRRYEFHNYVFNETIACDVTGYVPVRVRYSSCTGYQNCISGP